MEHTERAAYGGSSLCDYYMKTIPELCVKEAEGGFKLLYASKRYRMVYVTDHESEIIRWNRVKAPLGTRLRHCISRCFFVGNLIINHLTNKITNVQAYISVIIHEIYNMFEI